MNFNDMTRKFLMGESKSPSVQSYLQSLKEVISAIRPKSAMDERRLEMAQNHLREIRRSYRRLEEKVGLLEEQVKVLEEGKE
jgi:hypothetical protein|tara:strand:+ start:2136 stop:2381 length:246 start_codon:yes stop_codon:yes gene_type:complete